MQPVKLSEIQEIANRIAETFHPDKIFLFGSHAYGRPSSDSDVDLLISMNTSLRPVRQAVKIRQAVNFPFPVDLLVRTTEQIRQRLAMGDSFMHEVTTKGKVLYETHHG